MVASTRGQQAIPNNNKPNPATRVIASAGPETSVPKSLIVVGAMSNASPVTASSVEATASNTLSIV